MLKLISKKTGVINAGGDLLHPVHRLFLPGNAAWYGHWPHGNMIIQQETVSDFRFLYMHAFGHRDDVVLSIHEGPAIVFQVALEGTGLFQVPGLNNLNFHERSYNYYYLPEFSTEMVLRNGYSHGCIQIIVPLSWLELQATSWHYLDTFIARIRLQQPARLFRVNQVCNEGMLDKLEGIQLHDTPQEFEKLLRQLLDFSIEKAALQSRRKPLRYSQEEIDKIYWVKHKLVKELDQTFTLEALAKEVGINFFRLKKGFTEIYGISAHALQHAHRMKLAANLLADPRKLTMAEIADVVGYQTQESFVRAFRQHYGDYPQTFRSKSLKK